MARLTRRRLGRAAFAVAAAVGLSACGAAHPGAAAVVGGDRISVNQLHDLVARSTANPQAASSAQSDMAGFQRGRLTQMITDKLLQRAAANEGVTVTDGDIDSYISDLAKQAGGEDKLYAAAAASGVAKQDVRGYIRDYLLQEKVGAKLLDDKGITEVHAAHILVADKSTADSLLAQVKADPSKFAELAKQYSTDTGSKDDGGDLGWQSVDTFVKEFADAIRNAPDGSFVEVQSQFGWHVVHVIAHRTVPISELDPSDPAVSQASSKALGDYLGKLSQKIGVSVNPRFGTWSATQVSVEAPADGLSSPASSPAPTPSPESSATP